MFKLFRKIFPGAPPADDAAGRIHQLRGNTLLADGQLDDAAACYRQAIAVNPGQADGHVSLAYVLKELQRLDEAEIHLRQAIELAPDSADSVYLLATVLRAQGRHDDAIVCFRKALALKPDFDTIYAELGELLLERDCNSQAQQVLDAGLARDPGAARLLYLLGNVHARAGAHDQAVACFTKALVTAPDYADLHYHLGAALQAQDRLDDAIVSYQRAIALQSDCLHAYNNLGTALTARMRHSEALALYDKAITLKSDFANIHFNEGLCRLQMGDFEKGFQKHEWRWKTEQHAKVKYDYAEPLWLGNASLIGKTILLHHEQGLGDTIQFCRYIKLVAEQGATVLLLVPAVLRSLLINLPGLSRIITPGETLPRFDFHCPLMSLPLAFNTTLHDVYALVPYITANALSVTKWHAKLGHRTKPRIGLVWSGNPAHLNDHNRSIPLADLYQLVSERAEFVSLQKDVRPIDLPFLNRQPGIIHFGNELEDFTDTVGLIANVDLVISVDTSVAHLAGALGKRVWLLLPYSPDWRWLLDRTDSPWYPTATLFRQTEHCGWTDVIRRVSNSLNDELMSAATEFDNVV